MSPTVSRAEPVGSLLRPGGLLAARAEHAAGRLDVAAFKRAEDAAVDRAIAVQQDAGLDVVTDGEQRRSHFTGPLSEAVDGLGDVPAEHIDWHGSARSDEMTYAHRAAVTGRLLRTRSLAQEEFVYLRARAAKPVKITLPSPLMMQTFWSREHSAAAYRDPFDMFADAAAIVSAEIAGLAALGCRYVQIDAPELATLVDDSVRDGFRARGIDPERMLNEGVEILNDMATTPGVRHAIHLCRGNRDGHWMASGGYEAISRQVFRRAPRFEAFFLEYDDERSGGFEPLADLPQDRFVFLGLVSTKRPALEEPEALLRRIDEAGRFYPRDQLGLSPQCGFSSAIGTYPLNEDQQQRKLGLVADVARRAWPG
ncbi:MAG TPA: cobalamin-independent methionine synthase II family protein [Streptosporangiaceae bacterium]|nr:cobalamin-independent methionine synthase II family protein [Streptosporangiaceae bacterium]